MVNRILRDDPSKVSAKEQNPPLRQKDGLINLVPSNRETCTTVKQ